MKRLQWLVSLVLLWSAACASASPPTAAPTQPAGNVARTPTPVISTEFTPSDPATVRLAAGHPQLVEFYAVW